MLIPAIKCMKLKKNQPLYYYQEALGWIAEYKKLTDVDEVRIIKNTGKAWYKIGLIHVKTAEEASKQKKIIEQVEDNLSQVGLSLEKVARAKETIHELKQTVYQGMELSLEGLIKKKEFIEVMEGCYLGGVKLENINADGNPQREEGNLNNNGNSSAPLNADEIQQQNADENLQREEANLNNNGNPPAPLNADEIRQQNVDGNPQQEGANLNNNNNSQRIPLEGLVKKMIEQMIIDNESIKGLESDLKGKGLSLEKVIKQKEAIEKAEQDLHQMNLTLEEIIRDENLNNRDQINKYWREAGLSFTKSILNYPERYGTYKALGDLLCKLQNEEALNNAIEYYTTINNDTGVNHAFSLLEALFQNHFNTLKESLEVHYNILANSLNNQDRIDSTNAIKGLEAERKEIAFKKIDLKIRQGDYEVKKGKTQPARDDYQQATELANEENDKAKLNDIELKKRKSHQVDIDASKQDNIFIKASHEKLKTGKSWEALKIGRDVLDIYLKRTASIIKKYFPCEDDVEIEQREGGDANVVVAEIPPLNNGNAAGNVVGGAEIPPQDNGNGDNNLLPFVNLGPPPLLPLAEILGEGYHHE